MAQCKNSGRLQSMSGKKMSLPESPRRIVAARKRAMAERAKNRMVGILLIKKVKNRGIFSTSQIYIFAQVKGLYIHVPFCARICAYCDFPTAIGTPKLFSEYVDLLLREAELRFCGREAFVAGLSTAYFGGGTPTALPEREFARLFRGLENLGVEFSKFREVNLEGNPESAGEELLEAAWNLGVNRFSLGLQSFDDGLLRAIGRRGSARENREALSRLLSFSNRTGAKVSADLMFWLPGQTVERFESDVEELASSGIGHVSFYGLSLGENSVLGRRFRKGLFHLDESRYPAMYEAGVRILKSHGMERYEVSNFARPGEEGLHNRNYWLRGEYLGLGPGANGFEGNLRTAAPARYLKWKAWVEGGCPDSGLERDLLGKKERVEERIWLSLRMREGLDLDALEREEGVSPPEAKIREFVERGLLARNGSRVSLSGKGWLWMDSIATDLMP